MFVMEGLGVTPPRISPTVRPFWIRRREPPAGAPKGESLPSLFAKWGRGGSGYRPPGRLKPIVPDTDIMGQGRLIMKIQAQHRALKELKAKGALTQAMIDRHRENVKFVSLFLQDRGATMTADQKAPLEQLVREAAPGGGLGFLVPLILLGISVVGSIITGDIVSAVKESTDVQAADIQLQKDKLEAVKSGELPADALKPAPKQAGIFGELGGLIQWVVIGGLAFAALKMFGRPQRRAA